MNLFQALFPNPWSFTTVGDIVPPQISSTSPANNEGNVDPDTNIQVIFTEAIDPSSLNYICIPDPGGWFESWSIGNTVVILSHDIFDIGTNYIFYVTSGKDVSGNDLISGLVPNPWSFTTIGDLVAPQISTTSPADKEVNAALNSLITITFSEAMDISTIDYTCSPDPGGWFENWNIDNTVFTLLHNLFEIGTTYTFHITAGKDIAGNNLTSGVVPHLWDFTTISVESLIVTPSEVNIPLNGTVVLIAWAYDSQNNPITDIIYTWSLNNNLGTVSPQGTQAVTFKASSNEGTCYVNVTAGGKSAIAIVRIKSEDIGKEEPEDLLWISFLWLLIIIACIVIIAVILWKKGSKTEEGLSAGELVTREETVDEGQELTQESVSEPHPPPPPPTDESKQPPSTLK
jgi:hypothetical protein